ncbi:MAG: hypothetical protein H8D45_23360 [Bacteroidetes bacterium]|nr:hypothetical protein [Bacteroidota bacterium]MBL7105864.1 hypothetical protein [Bacteroidales bacterium]
MKKVKLTLAIALLSIATVLAQSPEAFKYQAAVRDNNGDLLINQNVGLRLTIRNLSPTGGIQYRESHNVTTNEFGMVSVALGTGTVEIGIFANITWNSGDKYLEVELDPVGGASYTSMGASQLLSVPYALYAKTAQSVPADGDWTVNGNDMYSTPTGNVGIGTNDPDAKLEVYKNSYIGGDGNIDTYEVIGTLGWYNNDVNSLNQLIGGISMQNTNGWWDGNIEKLDAALTFQTMENSIVSEKMRILHNGNVGIGITNPTEKLEVNGNVEAVSFIGDGSGLTGISGDNLGNHLATQNLNMANNGITNLLNPSNPQDAATKYYVDNNGDNLGNHLATQILNMNSNRIINVTNPSAPQDAATKSYVDSQVSGDNDWGINGDNVYTGTGGIYPSGNVGIGTDNPTNAKLEISNAAGVGIRVNSPGHNGLWMETPAVNGVYVNTPSYYGFAVDNPGLGGVYVDQSGENGIYINNSTKDGIAIDNSGYWGIDINGTTFSGLRLQNTGTHGIDIYYPGEDGIQVTGPSDDGLTVSGADDDGVEVFSATDIGVYAETTNPSDQYGVYTPDRIYGINITTKSISTYGKNTGSIMLEPGDVVCIAGGYTENVLNNDDSPIVHVKKVSGKNSEGILGVVEYTVTIKQETEQLSNGKTETRKSFHYDQGSAGNGDFVSIVVFGPTDVKANSSSTIQAGETLTSNEKGASKVRTTEVNGIKIAENVGVLGKALENSNGRGMVKVFINCK